jgi:hypothetical protein
MAVEIEEFAYTCADDGIENACCGYYTLESIPEEIRPYAKTLIESVESIKKILSENGFDLDEM